MRTLSDLESGELKGVGVLVRVDYNVPIDGAGTVGDATRIDVTLPSLTFLRDSGARVVLLSHLGRPGGTHDPSASLAPVARLLSARLGTSVPLIQGDPRGAEVAEAVRAIPGGGIGLLENIRYDPGETKNDPALAEALALLADGFVSDAFGVAHRAHASNVGVARKIVERGGFAVAGFLMARELHFLREALRDPARPFIAVMGGAKISGKLELIRSILKQVDRLLVGGAMANTFFRALGLETGDSLVEEDLVPMAEELLEEAGDRLILPVDCLVASELEPTVRPRVVDRTDIGDGDRVGDIGPRSQALFGRELSGAGTVVWNGPMGVFELEPFSSGTFFLAQTLAGIADEGSMVVLGGGDSAAAAHEAGVSERMTHVSTGGGASLDLLAGNELPGVSVLQLESE